MGLLAPHLSWVSGALRHFLAYCLVDEATKYGGILTFIDDAFSNLCRHVRGLAPEYLFLSKVSRMG
jgi:hypothetical protein